MPRFLRLPALAAVVLATACSGDGTPGVLVSPLATDIVFGLADETDPTPANFAPPVASPVVAGPSAPPPPIPEPRSSGAGVFTGGQQVGECPPAALTEFPDESASVQVRGTPAEGEYEFKRTVTTNEGDQRPSVDSGFQIHEVRNIERVSEHAFSFELVIPDTSVAGVDRMVVHHFLVNSNPDLLVNEGQAGQTIGVVDVPEINLQVPEPGDEAGIFLTRIESTVDGEETATFAPLLPVKYLDLSEGIVTPGDSWQSISLDPSSGDVLVHDATVTRANRIDACGDIVEGWEIEAEQTFNGATRSYRYTFATQYGAMLIGETTLVTEGDRTTQTEINIADQEPLVAEFVETDR